MTRIVLLKSTGDSLSTADLEKEQEKYFKDYQSTISDFLSKVASMPLQFGAYIFLVSRFTDEFLPLLATFILIISWSIFTVLSINQMLDNTIYLKEKFNSNFDDLLQKSKIPPDNIKAQRNEVDEKFRKTIKIIKSYKIIEIIFTVCILIICFYFIVNTSYSLNVKAVLI